MKDSDLSEAAVLSGAVNLGFTPRITHGRVGCGASGPSQRADVKNVVRSIAIRALSWLISLRSSQLVRVSKVLHASVGTLGLQWCRFSEEVLDAACFPVSGY